MKVKIDGEIHDVNEDVWRELKEAIDSESPEEIVAKTVLLFTTSETLIGKLSESLFSDKATKLLRGEEK